MNTPRSISLVGDTATAREVEVTTAPAFTHVRFLAALEGPDHDLNYLGPTLRGALGYALKEVACSMEHRECERCLLRSQCAFPVVFNGEREAGPAGSHGQPFALEVARPDTWWGAPDQLAWGVRLFGAASSWLPHLVAAFIHAGREGLGSERVRFDLLEAFDATDQSPLWRQGDVAVGRPRPIPMLARPLPDEPCTLRWLFHTPLQLARDGGAVRCDDGLELVLAGRRRLGSLCAAHAWRHPDADSPPARLERDDFETLDAALQPWAIERFSGRQRRRIPLEGTLGEVVIRGPWHLAGPWLRAVEHMHLGKHPTFGLGRVGWELLEEP